MAPVRSLGAEALARPRLEPHGTARLRENQAGARYLVGGRGEKPRGWAGDGRHDVLPLSIE